MFAGALCTPRVASVRAHTPAMWPDGGVGTGSPLTGQRVTRYGQYDREVRRRGRSGAVAPLARSAAPAARRAAAGRGSGCGGTRSAGRGVPGAPGGRLVGGRRRPSPDGADPQQPVDGRVGVEVDDAHPVLEQLVLAVLGDGVIRLRAGVAGGDDDGDVVDGLEQREPGGPSRGAGEAAVRADVDDVRAAPTVLEEAVDAAHEVGPRRGVADERVGELRPVVDRDDDVLGGVGRRGDADEPGAARPDASDHVGTARHLLDVDTRSPVVRHALLLAVVGGRRARRRWRAGRRRPGPAGRPRRARRPTPPRRRGRGCGRGL